MRVSARIVTSKPVNPRNIGVTIMATSPNYAATIMTEEMKEMWQNVKRSMKTEDMDDMPDLEEDNYGCSIDPSDTMKKGKYEKKSEDLNAIYVLDKKYLKWVRAHISVDSHVEMQKLKLYIMFRDQRKKQRIQKEREQMARRQQEEQQQKQAVLTPSVTRTKQSRTREEEMELDVWELPTMPMPTQSASSASLMEKMKEEGNTVMVLTAQEKKKILESLEKQ